MPDASSAEIPVSQPAPHTEAHTAPPQHNTAMAVIAYILFFIPLLTDAKNDPFVKFHVKQGLVLFICYIIAAVFVRLPVIGFILMLPLHIFLFIIWVIGILNALGGKQKHLPLIGQYGDKFEF